MQQAEKLTPTFLFKLVILSLLLFAGVIIKSPQNSKSIVNSENLTQSTLPKTTAVTDLDTARVILPYQKMVISKSEEVVSI
jgi:hypothetical protein